MSSTQSVSAISSPVSGITLSIADVPDPAFASGALGEGIAIEPNSGSDGGEILAPCDGELVSLQSTGHAFTIRSEEGAEILIHIGVDTVELNGDGFTVHVMEGTKISKGDLLITVDLDSVRPKVPSLATMMVVANGDAFAVVDKMEDQQVGAGDPVFGIKAKEEVNDVESNDGEAVEFSIPLKIAHGMHARPAAVLANAAKAHPGAVTVTCRGETVNAKSVVALMKLGTRYDDELTVRVEGRGADDMSDTLIDLIAMGLGDPIASARAPEAEVAAFQQTDAGQAQDAGQNTDNTPFAEGENIILRGRCAVAGFAAGYVHRFDNELTDLQREGSGIEVEAERLESGLTALRAELDEQINSNSPLAPVAAAHQALLDDPELVDAAKKDIARGLSAEWSWNSACKNQAEVLTVVGDARMAERASDMRDIAVQLIRKISNKPLNTNNLSDLPAGTIVLATEILPSEMSGLTSGHLGAILMRNGGPTSHASIIAAGLGIPTIVALGANADRIPDKASIIIDAGLSQVTVFPPANDLVRAEERMKERASRKHEQRKAAQKECHLADGTRIEVFANLAQIGEGSLALVEGAEGCGLLRTEFLFQDRSSAPSEEEQYEQYQAITDELEGRPLIIRTMDVGGDKPLSYLPLPTEDNPFLGYRGIRISLERSDLFRAQIRAILRVKPFGAAKIMVPMISSVAEMKAVKAIVSEEERNLGCEKPISVGTMVEVPAAAMIASQLAELCDFFSVGTNDLTQYALAMDRGNPAVAASVDALHPGVLRLIQLTAEGAAPRERLLAVCGGAASDPLAAPLLVGLGVRELSVAPAAIPEIKAVLSSLNLEQCEKLAKEAVFADGPEEVRALASTVLEGQLE